MKSFSIVKLQVQYKLYKLEIKIAIRFCMYATKAVFSLRFSCVSVCQKNQRFGMLNNGKVKNE